MTHTTVADLTVEELGDLIREVVGHTILETVEDPDKGLDLREDVEAELQHSLATTQAGHRTTPAQEVAAKLGLQW